MNAEANRRLSLYLGREIQCVSDLEPLEIEALLNEKFGEPSAAEAPYVCMRCHLRVVRSESGEWAHVNELGRRAPLARSLPA